MQVDLGITNRNVDLVAEGYDLAIRLGTLPDSSLVARQLEEASLCLVAAPIYLARVGIPHSLPDLAEHNCLPFVMPSNGCHEGLAVPPGRAGANVHPPRQSCHR